MRIPTEPHPGWAPHVRAPRQRWPVKPRDLLDRAAGGQVNNVRFADLRRLLEAAGFQLDGVGGSHHLYRHPDLRQKVNLQPLGRQAKPYQVRQVVDLLERYSLQVDNDR